MKQRKEQERKKTGENILRGVGRDTRKMWRKERMKKDSEFKRIVIKRQATTARRNLKSDNPFKKLTGKVLRKAGVELPGSVTFEQGLIKAKKKEGDFYKKKKRISKKN